MKKTTIIALAASLLIGAANARTWTSSDGSKTFEGKYVSHTEEHVVVLRGLNKVKVKLDLLSEDDRKWVLEQKEEKPAGSANSSDLGKIGSKIAANAVILNDGKYVDFESKKAPEYYLIYFSASW